MLKRFLIVTLILLLTFIFGKDGVYIDDVFSEIDNLKYYKDTESMEYHIFYDKLTTNNILSELSFFENYDDIKIVIVTDILDEDIRYTISSDSMTSNVSHFFDYCIKKYDSVIHEDKINNSYSFGIKINELIIYMPKVLADHYLENGNYSSFYIEK